jgi:AAA domain, putative AbiEii toxin, Type IV TA system
LLDEPDTHLNPRVQEQLVPLLAEIANQRNLKILMTTHSPFIVRGGALSANIAWINDGKVISSDSSRIQKALGWGAMGKRILIKTEDAKIQILQKLLSQWPNIERQVAIIPGEGFKTLPTPKQAAEFLEAMGDSFSLVVHRDKDCLTNSEAQRLIGDYQQVGAHLWLTHASDLESYFVQPAFLASYLGLTSAEADALITKVRTRKEKDILNTFASQRAELNKELYPSGGSPLNHDVEDQLRRSRGALETASGKTILNGLCQETLGRSVSLQDILKSAMPCEVALDLKALLTAILG